MNRFTYMLGFILVLLATSAITAQVKGTLLTDGDVPPNLIAKHFNNYENSTEEKWYQNGTTFYISFLNQGRSFVAKYNKSGRLLLESIKTEKFTPQQIEKHLDFKFGKYKVVEFIAVRDIENGLEFYEVKVKSKSMGLVTEWYDRSLESSTKVEVLAIN